MDATLLWTVLGSGAGVASVAVAVTVAVMEARSRRKHPPLTAGTARVLREPRGGDAVAAVTVLRAPTGRLPDPVRGRDELLARLYVLAERPDGQAHVLVGLGGTGKSTVALQVAEEAARSGRSVWWVPAGDAATMTTALLDLARALGASPSEVVGARAGRCNPADLLWRFLEARPGWLLIFDNADDLDALAVGDADAGSGAGWIRPTGSGLIVVTSRIYDPPAWGRHAQLHEVGWLDAATGARVLADLAPGAGSPESAAALSARLGGLPLALHHAGSQLASGFAAEPTFADYLEALDDRFGRLMGHGPADDRATVTSTWELSLDALAAKGCPQARPLLRVLSCLAPAIVIPPLALDRKVLGRLCEGDEDGVADGLAALSSVGLITTSPGLAGTRPSVTVHPLVTETSRGHLNSEDPARVGEVAVGLLAAATARLDCQRPEDWPVWLQLVPHLNAIYGYLASRLTDADLAALANVSVSAATAFLWAGSYPAAQELAQSALQHTTRLGTDHQGVLRLRSRVASAYKFRGKHDQAEQEYRGLLADMLRVLGPDHPDTLNARHDIARMLAKQGEHDQAEQGYRDLLADKLRVLGPDHQMTLATRNQIAHEMAERGDHAGAEAEYRAVLDAKTRVLGAEHADTLATRNAIAHEMAERGDHAGAEAEYRAVLDARTRVLGTEHPDTLATRNAIAHEMAERGDHQADQERVLGADHPQTMTRHNSLARTFQQSRRMAEAITLHKQPGQAEGIDPPDP